MEWFIWGIFAIIVFTIEIISPTFFFLFVGIGFTISGIISYFFPNSTYLQILISIIGMIVSFILFKKRKIVDDKNYNLGQSNELYNKTAKVLKTISFETTGTIRLNEPFLGKIEWEAKSKGETIEENEIVLIEEIHGNVLIVKRS